MEQAKEIAALATKQAALETQVKELDAAIVTADTQLAELQKLVVTDDALGKMKKKEKALAENKTGDEILHKIIDRIPIPVVPLHEHANVRVNA